FCTSFQPFYEYNPAQTQWQTNTTNWTFASEVTKYSPFGAELENKDALGRYSAAQYGYGYTLPIAVASNSKYHEMGFDGFEDYSFYNEANQNPRMHFSYLGEIKTNENITLSNQEAHTGKKSLKVNGGQTASSILYNQSALMPSDIPELDCATLEECENGCGYEPHCDCGDGTCPSLLYTFEIGIPNSACKITNIDYSENMSITSSTIGGCMVFELGNASVSEGYNGKAQICFSYNGYLPYGNPNCTYSIKLENDTVCNGGTITINL